MVWVDVARDTYIILTNAVLVELILLVFVNEQRASRPNNTDMNAYVHTQDAIWSCRLRTEFSQTALPRQPPLYAKLPLDHIVSVIAPDQAHEPQ